MDSSITKIQEKPTIYIHTMSNGKLKHIIYRGRIQKRYWIAISTKTNAMVDNDQYRYDLFERLQIEVI